jgi:DNA (cytosine-5)-methyltransferase 1
MDFVPRLTNEMAARVQGFAPEWKFSGRKTSVYRQIGNAFPPPVAEAIGGSIAEALGAVVARRTTTGSSLRAVS